MEVAGTNVRRLVVSGGAAMLLAIGAGACSTDDANDAINEAQEKLDPQSTEELEAAQAEAQQAYEDARARADATKEEIQEKLDELDRINDALRDAFSQRRLPACEDRSGSTRVSNFAGQGKSAGEGERCTTGTARTPARRYGCLTYHDS